MGTSIREFMEIVQKPVSPEERKQWWDEAVAELVVSRKMAEIQMAPYDPHSERVLRLLVELSRQVPEDAALAALVQRKE